MGGEVVTRSFWATLSRGHGTEVCGVRLRIMKVNNLIDTVQSDLINIARCRKGCLVKIIRERPFNLGTNLQWEKSTPCIEHEQLSRYIVVAAARDFLSCCWSV